MRKLVQEVRTLWLELFRHSSCSLHRNIQIYYHIIVPGDQHSVSNKSKLETATFRAKTRQIPPQKISPKTATILTLTATILEIFKYSFYKTM